MHFFYIVAVVVTVRLWYKLASFFTAYHQQCTTEVT